MSLHWRMTIKKDIIKIKNCQQIAENKHRNHLLDLTCWLFVVLCQGFY